MNNRTLAKPKHNNSTTFSLVFGNKLLSRSFMPQSANEVRDVSYQRFGHNFRDVQVESPSFKQSSPLFLSGPGRGAYHTCPPRVQAKLKIGQPDDKYEQEADRVAEQVMRMPEPQAQRKGCLPCNDLDEEEQIQIKPLVNKITPLLQRKIKDEVEEEKNIQLKSLLGPIPEVSPNIRSRINSLKGSGQYLPASERAFFEPRFGHNFSQVRLHADVRAAELARAVDARACTIGRDVVFGTGEYRPDTTDGKQLLAHELTHVVQQRTGYLRLQRKEEKLPCTVHAYDASDPEDTAVIPKDGSGIGVNSVADMVTKVNGYIDDPKNACSCVVRLEINGHGSDGNQSVGDGVGVDEDKRLDADSTDEHLNQLANIKFCASGLFMMLGCHVGRSRGKKLLGRLAMILPGKLIGGAQHYTGGKGLGAKKVVGVGDTLTSEGKVGMSKADPFLTSPYVRWYIVIAGKEYVINGEETESTEGKAKLKVAEKIKVKTPDGVIRIK